MSEDFHTVGGETTAFEGDEPGNRSAARLIVYHAAEGDQTGTTRMVEIPDGAEVVFGRSRSSTVYVDSERVSRSHARLRREGDRFSLEDLGSRNGTRVNGQRITGRTALASGDEIVIGPTTAILSVTSRMPERRAIGSAGYFEERLAAEVERGLRFQRRFALLMLRLDGEPDICDRGLARIASLLSPMDVLAEYGPDDLAILLPEADATSARERAARFVRAAGEEGAEARIGLALFPEHGSKEGALVTRVRAALRAARRPDGEADDAIAVPPSEPVHTDADVLVGDAQMERVFALARKVADHPITVLIYGETGVGKEVVAEAIHRASRRREMPYVRLNCASIPESLLESELFGHEKGAFTGADRRKIGYFEAASGGTIFLDEIGELRESLQSKLLRVLEEHRLSRVGGTREIEVDVRVVCATNRDLEADVAQGGFREDLFFRISAFTIVVPPLRDRPGEIPLFARHFLQQAAREAGLAAPTLADEAQRALLAYGWPGNVRELRNAMERAIVLHSDGVVDMDDLPDRVRERARALASSAAAGASDPESPSKVREQIADVEQAAIVAALEACNHNQTHAARRLGLSRRALIYKMEKYGLKAQPGQKSR